MMMRRRTLLGASLSLAALGSCASRPAAPGTVKIERLQLADGRTLEVLLGGDPGGLPFVAHHGTPGDATTFADWDATCRRHGLRLLCASRAGYANSTRSAGRSVADVAKDTAALLDHFGHRRFLTLGWSGGGPHALACAALLPGRCTAAATLGGVGAYGAPDLDFLAGMGPENVDEFGAALKGEAALRRWMDANGPELQHITGPQLAAALGGLVPEVDKAALTGEFAERGAASMRRALVNGFDGWIDDDLAFTKPWGFALASIRQPVTVWQGEQDLMVPVAHGRWLSSKLPGATARIVAGQGHLSLATGAFRDEIVAGLRRQAAA